MLRPLPIQVVPVDAALSYEAGMLRPLTLPGGLSLGDRYCLALAKREGIPALTAERRWPDIAVAADVAVELIR
jgi:ribonuclease VapC